MYREVIELKKEIKVRLSKLSCPFGKLGLMSKLQRQGCDGVDQNCDGRVDECAEDQVPPTIRLAQPMPTTPFADINSARDFLESHITVVDDCAAEIETDIVFLEEFYEKIHTAGIDVLEGGGLLDVPHEEEVLPGKKYEYGKSDSSYDSIQMYLKEIGQYPLISGGMEK